MRLEDMKSDIPETPDFIHKMIQNEVAKQIQDTKKKNMDDSQNRSCSSCLYAGSFHSSICRCKSVSLVSGEAGRLWCSG